MKGKVTAVILTGLLVLGVVGIGGCIGGKRIATEKFITQVGYSSWTQNFFEVSPDSNRVAYEAKVGKKWLVVVDGEKGKEYDDIGEGSLIFSPNSKWVAYVAKMSDKRFMVVDGKEGKEYDEVYNIIFSPDSKRVAYGAGVGDKRFMVVDGEEGKQYDDIVTTRGGRIIFDSPDSFHYLVLKGNSIYLVEENIK